MMTVLSVAVTGLGSIAATVLGIIACLRAGRRSVANDSFRDGTVLAELGYIRSGVDDIRRRQERQEEQYVSVVNRLSAVESSVKQAHKRLDELAHRN